MAGAAPQSGQPVATDPTKAADGQLFKGSTADDHDSFQKAREGMNEKLRQKQAADEAAAAADIEKGKTDAAVQGKAQALVDGIDISKIAAEVDADWQMAEKIRHFRTITPENEQKLQNLIKGVNTRRKTRIDALLNDPAYADDDAAAGGATGQPQAVQNPQEPTPAAKPGQAPAVPAPAQQLNDQQLLDSKLDTIRKEFETKLKKQTDTLEQERIRREEAERKMQEMTQAESTRRNQAVRSDFDTNAKKMGVPADLLDVAFGKASDTVNASQRNMSWDEIFASMKKNFPSLFRAGKAGASAADAEGGEPPAGAAGETAKKVSVKPGTGTAAGGKATQTQPATPGKKKEHESFAEARKSLSERASQMGQG